jgi:MFS family permease
LSIADRFSPSKVFFASAIMGAIFNISSIWEGQTLSTLLILRFLTGFFLAGIYPVGMKIAADYFNKGLGLSLSFLVGALVLGTAFPYLLNGISEGFFWQDVLITTSFMACVGGLLILVLVPNGPYRKPNLKPDLSAFFKVFEKKKFRSAAFGYFGHMWELYAFWAFVPILLKSYNMKNEQADLNVALLSFLVISVGGLSCVIGGYLSKHYGPKRIAMTALVLSCLCCLVSPWMLNVINGYVFITFLLLWGMFVIADSPLLSTLVAQNAEPKTKATALTIVNCIGFAITIISIQLLNSLTFIIESSYIYILLAIGPILGLIALRKA